MQYRFSRTLLFLLAGPIIWAGHFVFIYAVHGLTCARPAPHGAWAGLPLSSWIILGASLLALISMSLIYLRLRKRMPHIGNPRFLPWLAGTLSLLSALAIIWETIPVLLLPACG
ncbi:MAG: hypothetical protein WBF88_00555 [Pusillimonas sp.]